MVSEGESFSCVLFALCACPTRMVVVLQGSEEHVIPWNVTNFVESIFVVVYLASLLILQLI